MPFEPSTNLGRQFVDSNQGLGNNLRIRNFRTNIFESVNLSFANALRGDPDAALRALLKPNSLPPQQRQTIADQMGVNEGWTGALMRTVTNPFVLIGAILALKFRVPRTDRLFQFSEKLSGLNRNPGFLRMRVTGNIDSIFHGIKVRGKEVPEVYRAILKNNLVHKEEYLTRVAESVEKFERSSGLRFTPQMETALSLAVQSPDQTGGLVVKNLGSAWSTLINDYRGITNDIYKKVFANAEKNALLTALARNKLTTDQYRTLVKRQTAKVLSPEEKKLMQKVAGTRSALRRSLRNQLEQVGVSPTKVFDVKFVDRYFPHKLSPDYDSVAAKPSEYLQTMISEKQAGPAFLASASRQTTKAALPRHDLMLPNVDELRAASSFFENPEAIESVAKRFASNPNLKPYSTKFFDVMEDYINSTARAYSWTVTGDGPRLAEAAKMLAEDHRSFNRIKASLLRDSFIPAALGQMTPKQVRASLHYDAIKLSLADKLRNPAMAKVIGPNLQRTLVERLSEDKGPFAFRKFQNKLSGLFYLGGLGGNAVSASYNLFQTLLTTVPTIGLKATVEGLESVMKKGNKYFDMRLKGLTHERAVSQTFKEFAAEGLTASPITQETLASSLSEVWNRARSTNPNFTKQVDTAKRMLMSMFTHSETLVRLTAFEGTLAKGLREGLSQEAASTAARRVAQLTQFLGGPGATPVALQQLGPVLRQFGTFPLRYADWLLGTSTELGTGYQTGFAGRNWGPLGRALLTSGAAYEAFSSIGQDVSGALISGALPVSEDPDRPFSPFPFVPPAAAIVGGAAQSILQGETTPLLRTLPVAVPGGVAVSRFSAFLPEISRTLGRPYIDYNHPNNDGTYPLLTARGQLISFQTPAQVWANAFRPFSFQVPETLQEREAVGYFSAQAERISNIRREFLEALYLRNDIDRATRINEEYRRLYPGLGDIQIRDVHRQAVMRRAELSRLERVFFQLPPEMRPQLGQLLAGFASSDLQAFLGIDPRLLTGAGVSPRDLDPYRRYPAANFEQALIQRAQDRLQLPPGVGFGSIGAPRQQGQRIPSPLTPSPLSQTLPQPQGRTGPFRGFGF